MNTFRVVETSGSAKATGFAAAQCLAAAFIAIALMVGCADIRRANIEPPPAGVQLQDEGIAETVSHGNAAAKANMREQVGEGTPR